MKQLFLLPVFLLGFSFACDKPYEEVVGVKIGCPLESSVDYKEYSTKEYYGGDLVVIELDKYSFFDTEAILGIDGIVEGVILISPQGEAVQDDFEMLVESMESRWGKAITSESEKELRAVYPEHSSSVVKMVVAIFIKNNGSIIVKYKTKKLLESEEKQREVERSILKRRFEGL